MSRFLRDLIAIPGESCNEKKVVLRIKEEMEKVGFDKVDIDPMGNVLGYIGHGKHLIAMDAHIDTVGIGDPGLWKYDPYLGYEDEEIIIGEELVEGAHVKGKDENELKTKRFFGHKRVNN